MFSRFPLPSCSCSLLAQPQETRSAWFQFVSHHFRHPDLGGGLRSRDTSAIEYFLRRGEKMLDSYGSSTTTTVRVPETHHWPEGWVARGGKEAPKTGAPGPVRSGGKEGSGEGAK